MNKHTSHKKIYKLRKTNIFFSHFEGTRGEKNTNILHLECRRLSCDLDREYDRGGLTCGISGPDISSRNTICLSFDLDRDLERQRSLSCDLDREIDRDLVGDLDNDRRFGCRSRDIDLSLEKVNMCLD